MESNFESFEIQKLIILMNRAQRVDEKNSVSFSIYHVYSQNYGH